MALAAQDFNSPIYMLGFDMGPDTDGRFNNVYASTEFYKQVGAHPTFTGNWTKQVIKVMTDFPSRQFIRVKGATTADIPELNHVPNLQHLHIASFLERINNGKDL